MSRHPFTWIYCFFVLTFLIQGFYCKEISRLITGFRQSETKSSDRIAPHPTLSRERLHKIRSYDRMKCFPRVLCTLTKADAFKHLGGVDLNGLADGYLTLLSAFPGGPQMKRPQQSDIMSMILRDEDYNMNDEQQPSQMDLLRHVLANSASSTGESEDNVYSEDDDEDQEHYRRRKKNKKNKNKSRDSADDDDEEEEMLLTDPLLHQKEKLEVQKLMAELLAEDENSKVTGSMGSWAEKAMTLPLKIPLKIGSTLLNSVILPYLVSRRRRDLSSISPEINNQKVNFVVPKMSDSKQLPKTRGARTSRRHKKVKQEDPLASAMQLWKGLKDVKQCAALFPSCPFEAWEVVSMIRLVGDQSRQKRTL